MSASDDEKDPSREEDAALLDILMQFRAEGREIASEPVWADRVKEIFSKLPEEIVVPLASRIKEMVGNRAIQLDGFCQRHGLTPAEQKLLVSIADGLSVPEHAEAYGISVNTARVHMQRVLDKTGSNRQTDLLRKLIQSKHP